MSKANEKIAIVRSMAEAEAFYNHSLRHARRPLHTRRGRRFGLDGAMFSACQRPSGLIEVRHKGNLIVDVGVDFIADSIGKPSGRPNVMSHIAVGTGTTAANANDTTLETELARQSATYAHTADTAVFTFETTFIAGAATGALTEAGVVNASSSGIFIDRVVFSVINKGADDSLTQRFTFTIS